MRPPRRIEMIALFWVLIGINIGVVIGFMLAKRFETIEDFLEWLEDGTAQED